MLYIGQDSQDLMELVAVFLSLVEDMMELQDIIRI